MSQNEMILDYLQRGNSLTSLEALNLFGCFRLASRINDLKNKIINEKLPYEIESKMESHTDELGCEKHYKRYYLVKKEVEEVAERESKARGIVELVTKNLTLF